MTSPVEEISYLLVRIDNSFLLQWQACWRTENELTAFSSQAETTECNIAASSAFISGTDTYA